MVILNYCCESESTMFCTWTTCNSIMIIDGKFVICQNLSQWSRHKETIHSIIIHSDCKLNIYYYYHYHHCHDDNDDNDDHDDEGNDDADDNDDDLPMNNKNTTVIIIMS